jgi:hypothetical protein
MAVIERTRTANRLVSAAEMDATLARHLDPDRLAFVALVQEIERAATAQDWQARELAGVVVSVVRPQVKAPLFNAHRVGDYYRGLMFEAMTLKGKPGWCSDTLDWMVQRIVRTWQQRRVVL